MQQTIQQAFPVSEEEYAVLNDKFGDLCEYQSWQLIRKNSRNNHTDRQEDIAQEMRIAMLRAASYFKRQTYIEDCLGKCEDQATDKFVKQIVDELRDLWANKTRHGASRQKFGPHQEQMLEKLTRCLVPVSERPDKKAPLTINSKFSTYAKSITWNSLKALGKKITREKSIRSGMASLSEFDYLAEVL